MSLAPRVSAVEPKGSFEGSFGSAWRGISPARGHRRRGGAERSKHLPACSNALNRVRAGMGSDADEKDEEGEDRVGSSVDEVPAYFAIAVTWSRGAIAFFLAIFAAGVWAAARSPRQSSKRASPSPDASTTGPAATRAEEVGTARVVAEIGCCCCCCGCCCCCCCLRAGCVETAPAEVVESAPAEVVETFDSDKAAPVGTGVPASSPALALALALALVLALAVTLTAGRLGTCDRRDGRDGTAEAVVTAVVDTLIDCVIARVGAGAGVEAETASPSSLSSLLLLSLLPLSLLLLSRLLLLLRLAERVADADVDADARKC